MTESGENAEWEAMLASSTLEPPPPDEASGHRALRQRRIRLSIVSSLIIRPLSVLIPIITIPMFLHFLGRDRYGVYEAIGALATYLAITNAGLSMGLMNRLTDCAVTGDWTEARRHVSTVAFALMGLAAIVTLIISTVVPLVNWRSVLDVPLSVSMHELSWSVWLASVLTMIGLVASLPASVYMGLQETHRANLWEAAARIVTLVACALVCSYTHWGIVGVILAISVAPTACRLFSGFFLLIIEKPQLRPSLRLFDKTLLHASLSEGVLILVLQTSYMLLFQGDKLIISHFLGAQEVAGYAIVGRIFVAGYAVFMLVLTPLWPASGDAIRRGDLNWVRRSVNLMQIFGPGLMLLAGAIMLFSDSYLQRLLSKFAGGDRFVLSHSLICAITLTFVTRAWIDCRTVSLNSIGVFKPQIVFYTGHAVLNLIVAISVARRFGVEGVAWSTPITALVTGVWGYPYLMRKYVFGPDAPRAAARVAGKTAT